MKNLSAFHRALLCAIAASGLALSTSAAENKPITPSELDRAMASQAQAWRHATPAKTEAGKLLHALQNKPLVSAKHNGSGEGSGNGSVRYPADLQFLGGPTIQSMESHAIYVNASTQCPVSTCWGAPETFLKDLGKSEFIHVVDQYTGLYADNRYTVGSSASVTYPTSSHPYTDADVLTIVHAVALASGQTGYGHEYHVFLTPGTDECFDSTYRVCYSPDNPATFVFCAYHSSTDFSDIGHVIYSVEPFVNVPGCSVRPGTPNGQLTDSTNNTLSHETIESITDPDGDAWWNIVDNGLYGEEIGDECSFLKFDASGNFVGFDPSPIIANGHRYAIQPEYSNRGHACLAKSQD